MYIMLKDTSLKLKLLENKQQIRSFVLACFQGAQVKYFENKKRGYKSRDTVPALKKQKFRSLTPSTLKILPTFCLTIIAPVLNRRKMQNRTSALWTYN